MGLPTERISKVPEDDVAEVAGAFEADVQRRVFDIRNGTGHWPDVQELLAEMEQYEDAYVADDEEDDADPSEVEAAWAEEIQRRVEEIRSGAVKSYAAEDVMAAMRLRYG